MNWKQKIILSAYLYLQNSLNLFPDFIIGNRLRRLFYSMYFKKMGKNVIINSNSYFEAPDQIEIGNDCSFNRGCWISGGGGLVLHDDVIIGPKVIIHSANHNYSNPNIPIRTQGHTFKKVEIHNNVWICAGAIILPRVTIYENSIIGAGAVVTKDVLANSLFGGSPAKFIKNIYE
jgi:maltose O-acetyltransferase